MNTELVKIDPKEFGLEAKSVKTIEDAFTPKIIERDGLAKVYENIITKELTQELCDEAGTLRKKLVKVRTGIADVHRTQKAFFLASGKFVDAWKNKETLPVTQMEEKLSEIEKHFERIEAERVFKLAEERTDELTKYEPEMIIPNIGEMDESVWTNFLGGIISGYNKRKLDELNAEKERLRLIEVEKEESRLKAIEDEKIRKENERLKAEAETKEKALAKEREKAENERKTLKKIEADKRLVLENKIKAEREKARITAEKAANEKSRLEAEAQAKIDAEKAEAEAKRKADKLASQAPDKEKLIKSINEMVFIDAEFKTAEAQAVHNVINQKFEAFKVWAVSQTKSL